MFSLWYKMFFLGDDIINKIKNVIKFICFYILPTIIAIIFTDKDLFGIQYNLSRSVINIIVINLLYSSIIHLYIQKNLFNSLEKDVILKFVPDKVNTYIILRVLKIFIKAYLPVITLTILSFKEIFEDFKYIFYICSVMVIISIILLNVIGCIIYRYLLSVVNRNIHKLINFISFIYITSLIIYQSTVIPMSYLDDLERYLKNDYIIINKIHINSFQIIFIMMIFVFSIIGIKFLNNFLKIRGRNLIFIKNTSIDKKNNKIIKIIQSYCEKVYFLYFSDIEKNIFMKDIKEVIRENKYTLIFICLAHVVNIGTVLFFFFVDNINSIELAITSGKISLSISIFHIFISYLCGKVSLGKNINIDTDYNVLKNYNIKVTMEEIIKVKTKVLSVIMFPKLVFIFTIIIASSLIIYSNTYLALIYFITMIQLLFLREVISLWLVKFINKFNSNKVIIKISNFILISTVLKTLIDIYFAIEKIQFIYGQLVLLASLIVWYLFNLFINKESNKC